jgi:glycerate 2-kinase
MAEATRLRRDAGAIREAAIAAVQPEPLVGRRLAIVDGVLVCASAAFDPPLCLDDIERIVVVGAGKAAAGMAAGIAGVLGSERLARHRVAGLVSVPEGCGRRLERIEIRETRPAASNLPTEKVVQATREMLDLVGSLGPRDLAIAVITGGGSALLALPREGGPLAEKIAVARFLSQAGGDIRELNAVRQAASAVKAGGLARSCGAGRLVALVLSDVIGDPLDTIASGPCMPVAADPRAALAILARHGAIAAGVAPALVRRLEADAAHGGEFDLAADTSGLGRWTTPRGCRVDHIVLGSNRTAVDAAAACARELGYEVVVRPATAGSPTDAAAEAVGSRLAAEAVEVVAAARHDGRPRAVIEGGEATVVVPADHGTGGRNQQTVLAAIAAVATASRWPEGLLVASVGTDGEDGPTDAAGAVADADVVAAIGSHDLDVPRAVVRCDAHPLFAAAGGLIETGPTSTNVADVRIILARP